MNTKNALCGLAIAVAWQMVVLAGSAQTNIYLFTGYETNITLAAGTYIITAYGAQGGSESGDDGSLGAEMSAEFNFSTATNLTLLVGGGGGDGTAEYANGGGGGGGSFVVEGSIPLVIAGGGGGAGSDASSFELGYGNVSTNGSAGVNFAGETSDSGGSGGTGGSGSDAGGGGGGGGFLGNGGDGYYYGIGSITLGGGGGGSYADGGGGGLDPVSGLITGGFGGGGAGGEGVGGYSGDYYGSGGGGGGYSGGGGGGFGVPVVVGESESGGGGGSIIDSSAIAILAEVSGVQSPVYILPVRPSFPAGNGEIIITVAPLAIITANAAFGFTNGVFGFDVVGPSGSNVVIEASTDLQTWITLQTILLGSGLFYFSDPQSTTNTQRYYRAAYAYTVGGTLTGLPDGDTVTLQDNGSDNLALSTNGPFTFPTALPNGHAYSVTVLGTSDCTLPITCTLTNGSGTISGANVTNVAVQCIPNGGCPCLTGNLDVDMLNAAVADGTANGGVPAVIFTEYGGPFRVTSVDGAPCSFNVGSTYYYACHFIIVPPGTPSCSSTTLSGTAVQFGTALVCGLGSYGY